MIGLTKPYSVVAEFTEYPVDTYPSVSTNTASADITFIDPCLDQFTFAPTAQTSPDADAFSGNDI